MGYTYSLTTDDGDVISDEHAISFTEHDVCAALWRVNIRKAAGPDGIIGRLLQQSSVLTTIYNESLAQSAESPHALKGPPSSAYPRTLSPHV